MEGKILLIFVEYALKSVIISYCTKGLIQDDLMIREGRQNVDKTGIERKRNERL